MPGLHDGHLGRWARIPLIASMISHIARWLADALTRLGLPEMALEGKDLLAAIDYLQRATWYSRSGHCLGLPGVTSGPYQKGVSSPRRCRSPGLDRIRIIRARYAVVEAIHAGLDLDCGGWQTRCIMMVFAGRYYRRHFRVEACSTSVLIRGSSEST